MAIFAVFGVLLAMGPSGPPTQVGQVHVKISLKKGTQLNSAGVLYLEGHFPKEMFHPSEVPIPLSQLGSKFTPTILPILVGSKVDMTNNDVLTHNVFSESSASGFDTGYYATGSRRIVTFKKPGIVDVHCRIHPEMNGTILVLATPFFSNPNVKGEVLFSNVPVGTYLVKSFGLDIPSTSKKVEVKPDATSEVAGL